ncbi:MAG: sugar porter family MFS transporter [Pirellulaceae bacterium]
MASTLNTPAEGTRNYLFLISFIAALGGFLFGFDTAVVSGTLVQLTDQFQLTPLIKGVVVASALIGCMVGALMAGSLSDRFGRKAILIVSGVLFLVSAIGCMVPPTISLLICARWLGGVGIGIASMLSPMYLSEVSPPHLRGRLITLYQLAITIGIVVAYFSNECLQWLSINVLADLSEGPWRWILVDEVWRSMFGAATLPSICFLFLLLVVPETPRWLAKQGRFEESLAVLTRVVGPREAERELTEIRQALNEEKASILALLEPGLRVPLLIGILLPFFSQVSGINAIIYYGPTIFHDAGWELGESLGGQTIIGLVNVLFTLVAVMIVDRFGRKPMLYFGIAGLVTALIATGTLFALGRTDWQLVVALMFYLACFALSLGPVPWIIIAEIFPTRIRGRAMSVGTFTIWFTNTMVMLAFPTLSVELGPAGTFALFAVLVAPALLLTWKLIPETKGRSLEDIERSWKSLA